MEMDKLLWRYKDSDKLLDVLWTALFFCKVRVITSFTEGIWSPPVSLDG